MSRVIRVREGGQAGWAHAADAPGAVKQERSGNAWAWRWSGAALGSALIVQAILVGRLAVQVFSLRGMHADAVNTLGGFLQSPFATGIEPVRARGNFEPETVMAMAVYGAIALVVPFAGLVVTAADWIGLAKKTVRGIIRGTIAAVRGAIVMTVWLDGWGRRTSIKTYRALCRLAQRLDAWGQRTWAVLSRETVRTAIWLDAWGRRTSSRTYRFLAEIAVRLDAWGRRTSVVAWRNTVKAIVWLDAWGQRTSSRLYRGTRKGAVIAESRAAQTYQRLSRETAADASLALGASKRLLASGRSAAAPHWRKVLRSVRGQVGGFARRFSGRQQVRSWPRELPVEIHRKGSGGTGGS
jgi:hypothetical protein